MQTFLPYPDFKKSAAVLDKKRLGKQRVECKQIARALVRGGGWRHHPATRMWLGRLPALFEYYTIICAEWVRRGCKHDMTWDADVMQAVADDEHLSLGFVGMPWWFGVEEFHRSHQSKLLSKFPEHYSKYFIGVPNDLEYWWPTKQALSLASINSISVSDL
jgi:hypothetical protein